MSLHAENLSQDRVARNRSLLRGLNEHVKSSDETLATVPRAEWICECADEGCFETLEMTVDEDEALRQHPNRFAVAPPTSTCTGTSNGFVNKHERYWLVDTIEQGAAVAGQLDPRSD